MPRNLPNEIRALGPPDHVSIMGAIGDMMDAEVTTHGPDDEYGTLLLDALALLIKAAKLRQART